MRHSILPSCSMDEAGANLVVVALTDFPVGWRVRRTKERLRMQQNFWLLCSIMAAGDNFSFGGRLFLMSPHRMTCANPFCTFVLFSSMRHCNASGFFADRWAPYLMDARSWCSVQLSPQSTGRLVLENLPRIGAAG